MHAAFKEALIHDLSTDDFADMYAQTIAYGLLTARISRPAGLVADNLADMVPVTNPFLKDMLETFLTIGGRKGKIDFDELGINEVVQLLRDANMEAVLRDFGDRNPQEDPVIHFYELFLKEYDSEMRINRGVFYTPRPVVSYIVRSVHELLQTEFGIEDGLASTVTWGEIAAKHIGLEIPAGTKPSEPFVVILDPATGTGTFLVEAIDIIHKTMEKRWEKQGHMALEFQNLWDEYVPKHLLPRLHGYELLMAPYAIAHMKIGLKLKETDYRFRSKERTRIYLTNSLEPPSDEKAQREFEEWAPALAHEAQAVNAIKRTQHFTVIIGNPPYSNFSANLSPGARRLVQRYKEIDGQPLRERNALQLERNVNDDYLKFLAKAEDFLSSSGTAIYGMITNNSFIDAQTLRGVRARLLVIFPTLKILDLAGGGNLSGADQSVAEDENVFDIQQGVAVTIGLRIRGIGERSRSVKYMRILAPRAVKYNLLERNTSGTLHYDVVPATPPSYLFLPASSLSGEWFHFIPIDDCFTIYAEGLKTGFDEVLVGYTRGEVVDQLRDFAETGVSTAEIRSKYGVKEKGWAQGLLLNRNRTRARAKEAIDSVDRFTYRPIDFRYCPITSKLIKAPSRVAGQHMRGKEGICLLAARQVSGPEHVTHFYVSRTIPDNRAFYSKKGSVTYFPLYRNTEGSLTSEECSCVSEEARVKFAQRLGLRWTESRQPGGKGTITPYQMLSYSYAVFYSPTYRTLYDAHLKSEFPRVPITVNLELFQELVRLGSELVAFHLLESPKLSEPISTYIGPKNPEVEKPTYARKTVWLDKEQTCGFKGVPEAVWNFHIGGYQVCEKWLKDRKGRTLSKDNISHYNKIVVALSETIRLMKKIDEVIDEHGGWPGAFVTGQQPANKNS